jgi:hypothetical protein
LAVGNSEGLSLFSNSSNYTTAGTSSYLVLFELLMDNKGEVAERRVLNSIVGYPLAPTFDCPEYTRSEITLSWKVDDGRMALVNWTILYSSDNVTWNNISLPANFSEYLFCVQNRKNWIGPFSFLFLFWFFE